MQNRRSPLPLLFLVPFLFLHQPLISASTPSSNTIHLLQDVLKEISAKQKWQLEDIKVSKLDLRRLRFGTAQRNEFRVAFGKSHLTAKFSDEVESWRKLNKPVIDFGSLLQELSSVAVLETFKVEGPFELRVGAEDNPSLLLPMNSTYTGFNRILVGEGITIEIRGAREVSAFHASRLGSPLNESIVIEKEKGEFLPFWHSFCRPLVQIQIVGAAALVAYQTRNPDAYIETNSISNETIELLAEKCYDNHINKKQCYGNHINRKLHCPIDSLSSRISVLEKVLRSYLGNQINGLVGFFRGKLKASAVLRFQIELEKNFTSNDTSQAKVEWRTRPSVERVWFEILARVEGEMLKPLLVQKVNPFIVSDTAAWSSLMSNISFTKFPSLLVPSEALTLDVKW
ncbi:hypothetical protein UlMin_034387 [Ulmus minor]